METYRLKIRPLEDFKAERARQLQLGRCLVFTNGCFDLMHPGHTRYLHAARALGDYLVVAVNSDASVRRIKDPRRPILPEGARAEMLAALGCVDAVVLFDEETPLRVIQELMPDILVKGADWAEEAIVGAQAVTAAGGQVRRIALVEGFSTSAIIERILALYRAEGGEPRAE